MFLFLDMKHFQDWNMWSIFNDRDDGILARAFSLGCYTYKFYLV